VIASIYYKFDPESPLPHLVVIDGMENNTIYYNDPAAKTGEKKISVSDFQKGWKKRFIVIRPAKTEILTTAVKTPA
jgi:ABC-type bacteriocin/lantibiotic exporter with double-glycine peptidase domain